MVSPVRGRCGASRVVRFSHAPRATASIAEASRGGDIMGAQRGLGKGDFRKKLGSVRKAGSCRVCSRFRASCLSYDLGRLGNPASGWRRKHRPRRLSKRLQKWGFFPRRGASEGRPGAYSAAGVRNCHRIPIKDGSRSHSRQGFSSVRGEWMADVGLLRERQMSKFAVG